MSASTQQITPNQHRHLSPWRVMLGIFILALAATGLFFGTQRWQDIQANSSSSPWFASYVDVTATPTFPFEKMGAGAKKDVILSFIVSASSDPCSPTWGNAYTLNQAGESLDLDRRIARLRQQGGSVAVSFGGLRNNELSLRCTDEAKLYQAYKSVIDRYEINTIDLDLEGDSLNDTAAGIRRAKVIAKLQSDRRNNGESLAVWATLPVTPQGLSEAGTNSIGHLLANKVDLTGVNAMTMDYGESRPKDQSMQAAAESALTQVERQLNILYKRTGTHLTSATVWSKVGATPMIGQNDIPDEIFTLDDAKGLNAFALARGVGRMSMWSANRDTTCGSNYINLKVVSDSCSGIKQDGKSFAELLGEGFNGSLAMNAAGVTTSNALDPSQIKDDPATSPYQIWSPEGAYLKGTKVVWHRTVYEAKWWTQGDLPDSPVLQSWETPWQLVGPVMPGEKPQPQATLPEGTYPHWSGNDQYNTSARVLFNGVPYQAKWWTQGDSPAAASSNADSSPWAPLTQAQIDDVVRSLQKPKE